MADIITSGASTIAPTVILGYSSTRAAQTLVHIIPGRPDPDVTLRPAQLRKGTMKLGFNGTTSEATSKAAEDILGAGSSCALSSTDVTSVAMPFVVVGNITRELEDSTRAAWVVSFDWQETT